MRPTTIFFILVIYILLQFVWWSYLLIDLNGESYEHNIENVHLKVKDPELIQFHEKELIHRLQQRRWMIVGEGMVFLSLLGWVSYKTFRSYRKEMELAQQQKNFLLSITHEFKSPLASIRLYLQTIQRHELDREKQQSFITKAISDTERLDTLVENTLLANAIDHKGYSFHKESLNLSALVRLIVQKFSTLPDLNRRVSSNIEESISITGDRMALTVMLNNILENAAKYSPPDSEIVVTLRKQSGEILLSVSDEGIGVAEQEKSKVFQKFYRIGNEETRKAKGTGLGLYLTKYIVGNHNGTISIRNNLPRGTIFEVAFKET